MGSALTAACPCGSGRAYRECCHPLHAGEVAAGTAEALMRSRYSAYAVGDTAYLLHSWHSRTRPGRLHLDRDVRWTGLEILGTTGGGMLHPTGTVEFRAHFTRAGRVSSQHEVSAFTRESGRWVYLAAADPAGPDLASADVGKP